MKISVILVWGVIFALLVFGLIFTTIDTSLPFVHQLSNPEGSTAGMTSNQGILLVGLVILVLGLITSLGAILYGTSWFLSREVAYAKQLTEQPIHIIASEAKSQNIYSLVLNYALYIVIGLGLLMIGITLATILFS